MFEYILIAALVAIAVVVLSPVLFGSVKGFYSQNTNTYNTVGTEPFVQGNFNNN